MYDIDWCEQAKRLLKSELVRRGITNEQLAVCLNSIGIAETKTSIDSKISRGTFSAAFLLQCLNAIGCKSLNSDIDTLMGVQETTIAYRVKAHKLKKSKP